MNQRPLITTDSHTGVPLQLADELPEDYRSFVPHLEHRKDGVYMVRPDVYALLERMAGMGDDYVSGTPANTMSDDSMTQALASGMKINPEDPELIAKLGIGNVCTIAHPSLTPEGRLLDMARDGVVAEVLIGNGAFGANIPNPDANLAWARICNDWLYDTYKDHLHCFAPGITIPLHDLNQAAIELERAARLGLRPLQLPDIVPKRPYYLEDWYPIWEVCNDMRIPIAFHMSGRRTDSRGGNANHSTTYPGSNLTGYPVIAAQSAETVGWFVNTGLLERYPNLTIVMTETNAGWLHFAMDQWDHIWHGRLIDLGLRTGRGEGDALELEAPPSYYAKRNVKCTFMWDRTAVLLRHETGIQTLMWGNDYPHFEGSFPDSQHWVEKQFAGVPEAEIMAIVHDNAAETYGFTV